MIFKDKEEFKQVFLEYYNPLCNYVNSKIFDESQSEDLVQDVFLRLWSSREDIDLQESIKSYLYKASHNKAIEYLRSQKTYENAIAQQSLLSASDDENAKMLDIYIKIDRLKKSLRHLPPKCREVFSMHRFNGLTYDEIAQSQNISVKTVENHMLKAIKILREKVQRT